MPENLSPPRALFKEQRGKQKGLRALFCLMPSIADQPIHRRAHPPVATYPLAELCDQGAKLGVVEEDGRGRRQEGHELRG